MPFPADSSNLSDSVRTALVRSRQSRAQADQFVAQCDAGALRLHDVAASFLSGYLGPVKLELAAIAALPGIFEEFARQKPLAFADAAAAATAFQAARTAVNDMITFLEANIPVDAQRRVLSLTLSNDGSGTLTQRTIGAGVPLSAFRAQLVTFRDAFDV